ncbi:PPC domain-containing DNA-binding protein [Roseateles chitosanitabidus]|uniref:PPC domain-containing DNA-binding protein n=1 Tax=Roseateles chitosanitabidus TaxID=65048 RepID=UPI000A03EDB4
MRLQALRLEPGDDLRRALEALCAREGASGFVVAGIGSLTDARLRLAEADEETPIPGPSELVSLSGSLSPAGAHLHAVVADAQGRVVGGHVPAGCAVRTTAELLVAWLPAGSLSREVDARTGFKELVVKGGPPGAAPRADDQDADLSPACSRPGPGPWPRAPRRSPVSAGSACDRPDRRR